ncbi:putative Serine-threonine-protein, partial [Naja naja]
NFGKQSIMDLLKRRDINYSYKLEKQQSPLKVSTRLELCL